MTIHVAIVGAGPAGMSAAIEAVRGGARVTLIDEAAREGGQIYRQCAPELDLPAIGLAAELRRKRALMSEYEAVKGQITHHFSSTAHSLYPGPELQIANELSSFCLKPDAVILATGVSERAIPFPGWTLPGVLYAGAAQSLLKAQGIRAGDRIVISGSGALPIAVGAQMIEAGGQIAALAMMHSPLNLLKDPMSVWAGREILVEGLQYIARLKKAGVKVKSGWAAIQAKGDSTLETVLLAKINSEGEPIKGTEFEVSADLLLINNGFTANSELARMAGVKHRYDAVMGGWLPISDRQGSTSLDGVFVAGDGAGLRGALAAEAEGRIVGAAAAAFAQGTTVAPMTKRMNQRAKQERFQQGLRRTLEIPAGVVNWADENTEICRCEAVTAGRLKLAFSEGHTSLDAFKRNTRCGMGWCGGRTCLQNAALLARKNGADWPPAEMRARPVARPVTLGALANQDKCKLY